MRERTHIRQVGAGEHRVDAGQGEGGILIDADDPGVGLGAAHEGHFEHAWHLQIGDVALPTRQG